MPNPVSRALKWLNGETRVKSESEVAFYQATLGPGDLEYMQADLEKQMRSVLEDEAVWQRAQTSEIPFHSLTPYSTSVSDSNMMAERLLDELLGTVDTAVTAIAERVSALSFQIVRETPDSLGRLQDEVVPQHPAVDLLKNPGQSLPEGVQPLHTLRQQLYLTAIYLITTGEAYFLKIRDSVLSRRTLRLSIMPPQNVTPIVQNGLVVGYTIRHGDGSETIEESGEIIRIWLPNPKNIYDGRGKFGPQAIEYDARKFAMEHSRAHYERDATPRVVLQAKAEGAQDIPTNLVPTMLEQWKQSYHGRLGTKLGLPFRLPPGWEAQVLDVHEQEKATIDSVQQLDKHVLRAFKVPKSILGDISDAPARAGVETNQYVFDSYAIEPVTEMIADCMTTQWIKQEYGDDLKIQFVPFIEQDKQYILEQEKQDLQLKVRSPQQVLEDRGQDPRRATWGEYPVGYPGEGPYDGVNPVALPNQTSSGSDSEGDSDVSENSAN